MEKEIKCWKQASSSLKAANETKFFKRLFSEDDEVIILQGLAGTDLNSASSHSDIYSYFKSQLSFKPTRTQLRDKICKLKTKFKNKENSKFPPIFTSSHEQKIFDLSKKLWSNDKEESEESDIELSEMLLFDVDVFRMRRKLLDRTKKAEFDERWNNLKLLEIKFFYDGLALFKDLSDLLLKSP
ncbi:probable transcription factor At2g01370 [Cicer arietinum]|uniref:Probable transcription factor At1g11510 n=1 Tax=Cicer arietinum TaxID=3827 RepID=A0A1S2Z0G1_CICAR|nr:probable transcription factor At1g11510 [Cicer arietinum]